MHVIVIKKFWFNVIHGLALSVSGYCWLHANLYFFASIWLTWYAWLNLCFYLFYEWISHNIFFWMLFSASKACGLVVECSLKKSLKCFHLQVDTSIVFKFSGITQYVEDMVILYTSVSLNTANGPSHSIHTVCLNINTAKLQPFTL